MFNFELFNKHRLKIIIHEIAIHEILIQNLYKYVLRINYRRLKLVL